MARQREGSRVVGPYEHGRKWRLVLVDERGRKTRQAYETEREALAVKRDMLRVLEREEAQTLKEAMERYEKHLRTKGNKERSITTTMFRLRSFFGRKPDDGVWPTGDQQFRSITSSRCASFYAELQERNAVDTHRNTLSEARTFFNWSVGKLRRDNPLDGLDGVGRRRKGKDQLRIDEARKWLAKAIELAELGESGAVAAMASLLMGLRCSEIVDRQVRDLDDDGALFWVPDSKTDAGRRTQEVPAVLQPFLRELAEGRKPFEPLFPGDRAPQRDRHWVRKWVRRICSEVGVMEVGAHAMRGLHSTLSIERGLTGHVVAAALGHESQTTTFDHYAKPAAVVGARQRQVLRVLAGGRA